MTKIKIETKDIADPNLIEQAVAKVVEEEAQQLRDAAKRGVVVRRDRKGKVVDQNLLKPGAYTRSGQSGTRKINREVTALDDGKILDPSKEERRINKRKRQEKEEENKKKRK